MTPDEARMILSVTAETPSAQRLEAFTRQKVDLEQKLARAPTDGLKAKYRDAIVRLDHAIEVLEIAGAGADLPSLAPSSPATATAPGLATAPAGPAARPRNIQPPSKVPTYAAIAAAVLVVLGCGIWFVQHQSARSAAATGLTARITGLQLDAPADEIRSVAGSAADFPVGVADDYQAAVKSAWTDKEKALGARAAQIGAEEKARAEGDAKRSAMLLDDRLAEAKRRLNGLDQVKSAFDETVRQAERQVADVKTNERDAARTGGWQRAWLAQERAGSEKYLTWLTGQKVSNPAWVNLKSAEDFLRDKKAELAEHELAAADKTLAGLKDHQAAQHQGDVLDPLWKRAVTAWLAGSTNEVEDYLARFSVSPAQLTAVRATLNFLATPGDDRPADGAARLSLLGRVVGDQDSPYSAAQTEWTRREQTFFVVKYGCKRPSWAAAFDQDQAGTWADLTVGDVTQRLRWIKPGTFTMGSPVGEADRESNEAQHPVTISRGYWLSDSECTQAMWQTVMGSTPSKFTGEANRPVEQISYEDCLGFVSRLNEAKSVSVFGLPSEAQWEYACRAGTTTAFHGASLGAVGWSGDNSGRTTHAVKQKQANAWGLYDMHGNVGEWCSDWYGDYGTTATDPLGPASGSFRVFRGGSWFYDARHCRSAYRDRIGPGYRRYNLGFRLSAQSTP